MYVAHRSDRCLSHWRSCRQPTEIDYLNGEIVRLGRTVGVPTPLNASAVALVHEVARTRRFLSSAEIQREIERGRR